MSAIRFFVQTVSNFFNPTRPRPLNGTHFSEAIDFITHSKDPSFHGVSRSVVLLTVRNFLFHGTNSAILPGLEATGLELHATGHLLAQGIAPMGGELSMGGLLLSGINQTSISAYTLSRISACWETYATDRSCSFKENENLAQFFLDTLTELSNSSPTSDYWDGLIVKLLQIKQWNFSAFEKLCETHQEIISKLLVKNKNTPSAAQKIQKLIDYDLAKLQLAITDRNLRNTILEEIGYSHQLDHYLDGYWSQTPYYLLKSSCSLNPHPNYGILWKPVLKSGDVDGILLDVLNLRLSRQFQSSLQAPYNEKPWVPAQILEQNLLVRQTQDGGWLEGRKKRLEHLFNLNHRPLQLISEKNRLMVLKPFPIVLGSTTLPPKENERRSEYVISSGAKLGKEFDLMIVRKEDFTSAKEWLVLHQLADKVGLYTSEILEKIKAIY